MKGADVAAYALLLAASCSLLGEGCAATKADTAEAIYLSQQLSCVDQAASKADADACRAKVKAAWAHDGGVE